MAATKPSKCVVCSKRRVCNAQGQCIRECANAVEAPVAPPVRTVRPCPVVVVEPIAKPSVRTEVQSRTVQARRDGNWCVVHADKCYPPVVRPCIVSRTAVARATLHQKPSMGNAYREALYGAVHADIVQRQEDAPFAVIPCIPSTKPRYVAGCAAFLSVLPWAKALVYRYLLRYAHGYSRAEIAQRVGFSSYTSDGKGGLRIVPSTVGGGLLDDIVSDAYCLHRERKLSPRAALWAAAKRMVRQDGRAKVESHLLRAIESKPAQHNGTNTVRNTREMLLAETRLDFPELFQTMNAETDARSEFREALKEPSNTKGAIRAARFRERQRRKRSRGAQLSAMVHSDDIILQHGKTLQAPRHYASKNRANVGVAKTVNEHGVNPFVVWTNKYGESMAIPAAQLRSQHYTESIGHSGERGQGALGKAQTPYTVCHRFIPVVPMNEAPIDGVAYSYPMVCKQVSDNATSLRAELAIGEAEKAIRTRETAYAVKHGVLSKHERQRRYAVQNLGIWERGLTMREREQAERDALPLTRELPELVRLDVLAALYNPDGLPFHLATTARLSTIVQDSAAFVARNRLRAPSQRVSNTLAQFAEYDRMERIFSRK